MSVQVGRGELRPGPLGRATYPESLQKILPPPQSAAQGGLRPVLGSWRAAQASGLSTETSSQHPSLSRPTCPQRRRDEPGDRARAPCGDYVGNGGGVQEAQSLSWGLSNGLSYSWKGARRHAVWIAAAPVPEGGVGSAGQVRERGGPLRAQDWAESPPSPTWSQAKLRGGWPGHQASGSTLCSVLACMPLLEKGSGRGLLVPGLLSSGCGRPAPTPQTWGCQSPQFPHQESPQEPPLHGPFVLFHVLHSCPWSGELGFYARIWALGSAWDPTAQGAILSSKEQVVSPSTWPRCPLTSGPYGLSN